MKRPIRIRHSAEHSMLLDIVSFGRRGPGAPLSREQFERAGRTAARVPEVVVRVSGGARSLRGVASHVEYIGREGESEIETDTGERLQWKGVEKALLEDWDLDLETHSRYSERAIAAGRKPPKLVHNVIFSMPKGTPPKKVLEAMRRFAKVKFGLEHRYAMALHADQGAPHVHLVVKAMSEPGVRLNIRKATLREWRQEFAHQLRDLGVAANATERAVRGQNRASKTSGIYWAMKRGDSTHYRNRAEAVAQELLGRGRVQPEVGKARMVETRERVVRGWLSFAPRAEEEGHLEVANLARRFAQNLRAPQTDKEWMAAELLGRQRGERAHEPPRVQ